MEKAESLVDQIQEVQEGAREEQLQKEVSEGRCDWLHFLFPKLHSFTCALEEDCLDSQMGQHYLVTLNIEPERPRPPEVAPCVQGLVLFSYSCVTPRMKFLRLWLVG